MVCRQQNLLRLEVNYNNKLSEQNQILQKYNMQGKRSMPSYVLLQSLEHSIEVSCAGELLF